MNFIKVTFTCNCCKSESDIYFEEGDGINGVFDYVDCGICNKNELIGVGDLGYRTDFTNPDSPPWQPQFIRINYKYGVCSSCSSQYSIFLDYSYLITDCHKCESKDAMAVKHIENSTNDSLERLINELDQ